MHVRRYTTHLRVSDRSCIHPRNQRVFQRFTPFAAGTPTSSASSGIVACNDWLRLDAPTTWQGTFEDTVTNRSIPVQLSPAWRLLLLSDGSVTRHLQLLTGKEVQVDCFEMSAIAGTGSHDPPATQLLTGTLLRRQVWLHAGECSSSTPLVYACSWWNEQVTWRDDAVTRVAQLLARAFRSVSPLAADGKEGAVYLHMECRAVAAHIELIVQDVNSYLKDRSKPIWVSLASDRTELYRDIQTCYFGHNAAIEDKFQSTGPFAGRHYVFWHDGRPLTVIYEAFSRRLEQYLGPMQLT